MNDDFFYMFFSVARKTGRRLGEYWEVRVKDIDVEKKIMLTRVLKRRKRVEREAILDDALVYLIKRYVSKQGLKLDDYLFRKVSYRQIQNKVKTYAKKAGIQHNVSFHNFRHYFVTELLKKGWSYDKISKLTGHSTPQTLVSYDHMVASDIADDARSAINDI
jgi:integrase